MVLLNFESSPQVGVSSWRIGYDELGELATFPHPPGEKVFIKMSSISAPL